MKNIYLFNPITCELNKTTYKELRSLTGKSLSSLYSAKCDLSKLRGVGMYIVDDSVTRKLLSHLVAQEFIYDELWKRIPDSNVEVSSYGRYRRVLNKGYKYMIVCANNNGQEPRVNISVNGEKNRAYAAHYWVIKLFCEDKIQKPGQVIIHIDGKRFNNHYTNLKYDYKRKLATRAALKTSVPVLQIDPSSMEPVDSYESEADAARSIYISKTKMCNIVNSGTIHDGYLWIKDEEMMNSTLYK